MLTPSALAGSMAVIPVRPFASVHLSWYVSPALGVKRKLPIPSWATLSESSTLFLSLMSVPLIETGAPN